MEEVPEAEAKSAPMEMTATETATLAMVILTVASLVSTAATCYISEQDPARNRLAAQPSPRITTVL